MESLRTAVWLEEGLGEVTGGCDCERAIFALTTFRMALGWGRCGVGISGRRLKLFPLLFALHGIYLSIQLQFFPFHELFLALLEGSSYALRIFNKKRFTSIT